MVCLGGVVGWCGWVVWLGGVAGLGGVVGWCGWVRWFGVAG